MEKNGNTPKHESSANGYLYSFDGFELDPANRILRRGSEAIPLAAKVFDVLVVFAENPGRLLEKNELIERVWREDFVEEGNLARHVSTLRKALGDNGKDRKYIVTVQGRGYRFVTGVSIASLVCPPQAATEAALIPQTTETAIPAALTLITKRWLWAIPVAALLLIILWVGKTRLFKPATFFNPGTQVKSLAILPLKSLDASENQMGAGIADGVIRKISQTGQLTVRPTSAVLKYAKEDTDSLTAARQLGADAVLEGTVQRVGDRLRVTVILLRTSDGSSLYTDNFDLATADVFEIQDKVAQQIASRLRVSFDAGRRATLERYPTDPRAYEAYIRGLISLDERGYDRDAMPQMADTVSFFKKAIEIDPNYALAHAQLAFAYVWTALFIEPGEARWVDLARAEIKQSSELDSDLAESHVAHALLLWSSYEGYQNADAIRELRLAKQLNPNIDSPAITAIYAHVGLDDLAMTELNRALEINPTSQSLRVMSFILPYLREDSDAWFAEHQKVGDPLLANADLSPWYYLRKGRLDDAEKVIEERLPKHLAETPDLLMSKAQLLALKGDFRGAQAIVPQILGKIPLSNEDRHHLTYDAACVYALAGNSRETVTWLKETAATGFPNYPLFAHDPFLDRIRQTPEFMQFLAEQRTQWEQYRQEFN